MMQEAFWRIVPVGEPIPDKPESNRVQAAQKPPGVNVFSLLLTSSGFYYRDLAVFCANLADEALQKRLETLKF